MSEEIPQGRNSQSRMPILWIFLKRIIDKSSHGNIRAAPKEISTLGAVCIEMPSEHFPIISERTLELSQETIS